MTIVEGPKSQGLFSHVQNLLKRPHEEWDVIDAEPATVAGLFTGYAMIIAAIPALARLIWGLMPHCAFIGAICVTWNPLFVAMGAVFYYVVSLVAVFVVGLIIDALAPSFGGEKNQVQAMKVAVYSFTAAWLAGVFIIVPILSTLLTLLGLYSLFLLYAGLPKLMKTPDDKAFGYTAVVVLLAFVVFVAVSLVANTMAGFGTLASGGGVTAHLGGGSMRVGSATVDLGKLNAAASQMEADARQAASNTASASTAPVDPEKLEALLPNSVAGAPRTDISATTAGAGALYGSNVEATYERGDAHITLTVTDLAAARGLAALAGAINVQSSHQTATGYEKVSTVGGRMITEKYDNQAKSGEYSVTVASRFNVAAEGHGVTIDDLKGAVAAIPPDRLEALAHG